MARSHFPTGMNGDFGTHKCLAFLRIDSAGCIIVTIGLPDPGQLFAHPI